MSNTPRPPEPARVLQAALDVFVYAPLGAALEARDRLPQLAERGRNQLTLVRLLGRFAVQRGRAEADRVMTERPGGTRPPTGAGGSSDGGAPAGAAGTGERATVQPDAGPQPEDRRAPRPPGADVPERDELPIPGYDSLSASQVLPRLGALGPAELEQVRHYEQAHRARRTILNRIAQLRQD